MRKLIYLFIGCVALLTAFSCEKSEDENTSINIDGGSVYRYQMVTITTDDLVLDNQQYHGELGNIPVTLARASENTLVFMVPQEMALGNVVLKMPELNDSTVKYKVLEQQLSQSPTETMEAFSGLAEEFLVTFDVPETSNAHINLQAFQSYYQNASDPDKREIALFYQVNKQAIDNVLSDNFQGRFTQQERDLINKFKLSIAAMAVGGVVAVEAPHVGIKTLGIAVASMGFFKAIDYHNELSEHTINVIQMKVNQLLGDNDRGGNFALSLADNVARTVPFTITESSLVQGDSGSTQPQIADFFSSQSDYNTYVGKVNSAISWVNANVPLVNFSAIGLAALPQDPITANTPVTSEMMSDITFSVSHPNLQLVNASLQATGQLKITVKIIGSPSQLPVASTLRYAYDDGFSTFSGTLPIEVGGGDPESITITATVPMQISAIGQTLQLTASVEPAGATQNVTWSVQEGSAFATVSSSGLVTATAFGVVKVRATHTEDASVFGEVTVPIFQLGCGSDTTLTDIDGNVYPILTFAQEGNPSNSRCVTQRNLTVTHYRNGDVIPQVTDPAVWASLTTGAWCYYDNDPANEAKYGKLYNLHAVNDPRGLAPEGWYVFDGLFSNVQNGGVMKTTTGWQAPNTGATNATGFSAVPGGFRRDDGSFGGLLQFAFLWSPGTVNNGLLGYHTKLYYNSAGSSSLSVPVNYGCSVRVAREY